MGYNLSPFLENEKLSSILPISACEVTRSFESEHNNIRLISLPLVLIPRHTTQEMLKLVTFNRRMRDMP